MTDSTSPRDDIVAGAGRRPTARELRIRRWCIAGGLVLMIGSSLLAWPLTGSPLAVAYTLLGWGVACLVIGPVILIWAIVLERRRRPSG